MILTGRTRIVPALGKPRASGDDPWQMLSVVSVVQ